MSVSRRKFVKSAGAVAGGLGLARMASGLNIRSSASRERDALIEAPMPMRPLGKTGRKVSIYALGSGELPGGEETVKTLHMLVDGGVNYFDTAPSYLGTRSETTYGLVMKTRRKEVFLATKTLERKADGAYREIQESLRRLQTDHIDLLQIHAVNDSAALDAVLAKGGAIEGLERAKKDGLIRHIGITGHTRPEVISKALDLYPFETILIPLSALDAGLNDFATEVLPKAKRLGIGIVGMKALKGIERAGQKFDPERFMRYVWTMPVSTCSIGLRILSEAENTLAVAKRFKPMPAKEMRDLEKEVASLVNDSTLWWKRR